MTHSADLKALTLLLLAGVSVSDAQEPRRRCRAAEWPKRLPALDAVVDSAALFDLVDTSSASDTSVVVSILYKDDGTAVVRLVDPDGPPLLGTFLLQSLSRGLRRITPLPSPMGALRVRLRAGPRRAGIVERSVYCPPAPAPNAPSGRQVIRVRELPGERMPTPGTKIRLDLQLFIDAAGLVTDVRMNARSGMRELDEAVVNEERLRRFLPATIDGLSVPSWTKSNGSTMRL